jgi:hypothetical protein
VPLTTLTSKKAHCVWIDECEQSFQEQKNCLIAVPVLALPTRSSNFVVYSDASKKGRMGAYVEHQCYCLRFMPPKGVRAELSYA